MYVLYNRFFRDDANQSGGLHAAAAQGNVSRVKQLLKAGTDVNAYSDTGVTPLHLAVLNGREEAMRELLCAGADVDARDSSFGEAPLHLAVRHMSMQRYLSPGIYEPWGFVSQGHRQLICTLLRFGAEVDSRAFDGTTPLLLTAELMHNSDTDGYWDPLLAAGANVSCVTASRRNVLHLLAMRDTSRRTDIASMIGLGVDVNAKDDQGYTPLEIAVQRGQLETVKHLLRGGADVYACKHDSSEPSEVLTSLAAAKQGPATLASHLDVTLLHLAAAEGAEPLVADELQHGADLTAIDGTGHTSLHMATLHGRVSIVQMLIDAGVDVNMLDDHNRSPLHYAVMMGHEQMVRILLGAGASAHIPDSNTIFAFGLVGQNNECVWRLVYEVLKPVKDGDTHGMAHAPGVAKISAVECALRHCFPAVVYIMNQLAERGLSTSTIVESFREIGVAGDSHNMHHLLNDVASALAHAYCVDPILINLSIRERDVAEHNRGLCMLLEELQRANRPPAASLLASINHKADWIAAMMCEDVDMIKRMLGLVDKFEIISAFKAVSRFDDGNVDVLSALLDACEMPQHVLIEAATSAARRGDKEVFVRIVREIGVRLGIGALDALFDALGDGTSSSAVAADTKSIHKAVAASMVLHAWRDQRDCGTVSRREAAVVKCENDLGELCSHVAEVYTHRDLGK